MDNALFAVEKTARPFGSFAQVRAADQIITYMRAGTGHPVLLLDIIDSTVAGEWPDAAVWPALVDRLARNHRVILPEIPSARLRLTTWLRGFIDGLGLPPLTLVAASPFCLSALEFVLADPDRVARLVLVPAGAGGPETGHTGTLTPAVAPENIPMLVLHRDHPIDDAMPVIERFLAGEMP